jgi:hypothetical protein
MHSQRVEAIIGHINLRLEALSAEVVAGSA